MTILEKIFKDTENSKINSLNRSFFNNYIDSNSILKLIDIRKLYLDILSFEDNKEEDIHTRNELKNQLNEFLIKKNELENKNFVLLKQKIKIVKELTEKIDIRKLELEKSVNENIINNINAINELNLKAENINNEINSLTINKYDKDMLVNALKYKINNLTSVDINYLTADKKDLYYEKISDIIINDNAKKCYVTYLFEMISSDLDNLYHVYDTAKKYIQLIHQKDNNLELENKSIMLEYIVNAKVLESINDYIDVIINNNLSNNRITEISNEKLKHNSIIHTMIHFAKNYKELFEKKEIINKEYEMIRSFIVDLMRDTKDNNDEIVVKIINDTIDIFKSFSENIDSNKD